MEHNQKLIELIKRISTIKKDCKLCKYSIMEDTDDMYCIGCDKTFSNWELMDSIIEEYYLTIKDILNPTIETCGVCKSKNKYKYVQFNGELSDDLKEFLKNTNYQYYITKNNSLLLEGDDLLTEIVNIGYYLLKLDDVFDRVGSIKIISHKEFVENFFISF